MKVLPRLASVTDGDKPPKLAFVLHLLFGAPKLQSTWLVGLHFPTGGWRACARRISPRRSRRRISTNPQSSRRSGGSLTARRAAIRRHRWQRFVAFGWLLRSRVQRSSILSCSGLRGHQARNDASHLRPLFRRLRGTDVDRYTPEVVHKLAAAHCVGSTKTVDEVQHDAHHCSRPAVPSPAVQIEPMPTLNHLNKVPGQLQHRCILHGVAVSDGEMHEI